MFSPVSAILFREEWVGVWARSVIMPMSCPGSNLGESYLGGGGTSLPGPVGGWVGYIPSTS